MNNSNNFQPNWYSSPGDTIADILFEKKLSITKFAIQINSTTDYVEKLIHGREALNKELSYKLEQVLGPPADFWLRREFQYRESAERIRQAESAWLKSLPIKDMINWGWISSEFNDKMDACLKYFNVASINAWHNKYQVEIAQVNFRTSPTFKPQPAAVAAWLRQGEIQSANVKCESWNASLFLKTLKNIKELTRIKDPNEFLPILIKLCSNCGVAVAIVRTPTGCQASGVTKFISPTRALLMLSFRYLTDDHFWFTFFHEAGHLLLHGNKSVFVEDTVRDKVLSKEEIEANEFAAEQLIPTDLRQQLMKLPFTNKKAVVGFASLAGVSPGIVIGQLQHSGRVDHGKFNMYKRRYSWDNIKLEF